MAPLTAEQATSLYGQKRLSEGVYNQIMDMIRKEDEAANPQMAPTPQPPVAALPPAPAQSALPTPPVAEPTPVQVAGPPTPEPTAAPVTPVTPTVNIPDAEPAPQAAAPGTLATDRPPPTTQPGGTTRDSLSAGYDEAFTNQALAAKQKVEAAQQEADIKSAGLAREADNMAAYQAQNQKRDLEARAQLDDFQKQYQEAILQATSAKVDPNHYWADKSTSQRILARIAIALGGVGAALRTSDNKNHVLEMIEKDIDRDIDAQKEQLQKNFQAATAKGTLYSMMRAKFDDDRQATLAAQSAGLKIAELKMSSALSKVAGEGAKADGLEVIGKLQERQADKEKELLALKGNQITVDQMDNAARVRGADEVYKMLQDRDPKSLDRFFKANVTVGYDKDGKPIQKMVAGLGSNETPVKNALEGQNAYEAMMSTVSQILDLRQQHGVEAGVFSSQARAQAKNLQVQFAAQYKEAQRLGALDNGVLKLTGALIPEDPLGSRVSIDPYGIFERLALSAGVTDSVVASIKQLQGDFTKAHNKALQTEITHFFPGLGIEDPASTIKTGRVKY